MTNKPDIKKGKRGRSTTDNVLTCSFCGKGQDEVKYLIAGPTVYVCEECIEICVDVLFEKNDDDFKKKFLKGLDIDANWLNTKDGFSTAVREITFPPEHYEAGMTILNAFSNIVRQRYAKEEVRVCIQQDGLKITLIIESPDGKREAIEKTIDEYQLVLSGDKTVDEFAVSNTEKLQLTQQLNFAKLQLETTQQLLDMEKRHSCQLSEHNSKISAQYDEVLKILSIAMKAPNDQLEKLSTLISDICESQNNAVIEACSLLQAKFEHGIKESDESEIKEALKVIANGSPSSFERLRSFIESTAAGVTGNYLYSWLLAVSSVFPK